MAQPIAGWYPDPSGDASKLRYWDGNQWTANYMDNPSTPVGNGDQQTATSAAESVDNQADQTAGYQAAASANGTAGNGVASNGAAGYQQGAQPQYPVYYQQTVQPIYPMTKEDQILRLISFIFCIISTVSMCWAIIPLAWCIPMTVRSWGIYKGTKPNTVAFSVCTLIFVSLVSGILLLVSNKDE